MDQAVADAVEAKGVVDTLYQRYHTALARPRSANGPGDTKTQTLGILKILGDIPKGQGYGYGDVVMLHVYLAADPAKGGKMDGRHEGRAMPRSERRTSRASRRGRPSVASLVDEGQLVEIRPWQCNAKPR